MGCDIHMTIYVENPYGDVPEGMSEFWSMADVQIDRDYRLFAAMAGVRARNREDIEPVAMPRGLPTEIKPYRVFGWLADTVDGHSHSWLTPAEFEEAIKRAESENASAKAALEYARAWFNLGRRALIVFCFDN